MIRWLRAAWPIAGSLGACFMAGAAGNVVAEWHPVAGVVLFASFVAFICWQTWVTLRMATMVRKAERSQRAIDRALQRNEIVAPQ